MLSVVSNAAVVVGPAVGGAIATVLPAQRVFLAAAVFAVAAFVPAALLVERVLRVRAAHVRLCALTPDAAGAEGQAAPGSRPTFADSVRTVFAAPSLALLLGVGVLAYAGYGAFDPLESLFYRDVLHVDISWMGWLSSAVGVGSVAGALPLFAAPGLAEVFGVQRVLIGASLVVLVVPLGYVALRRRTVAALVAEERRRGEVGAG
nr:hypothetical protein [Collinsella intestinalis]